MWCRSTPSSSSSASRHGRGWWTECPGLSGTRSCAPVNPGDPYIVLTLWESRAAFDAWVKSDEFVKGHARSGTLPEEAFMQPSQLELHEVFTDSSQPDLEPEPRGKPVAFHGT